jgi:hypothetical protein
VVPGQPESHVVTPGKGGAQEVALHEVEEESLYRDQRNHPQCSLLLHAMPGRSYPTGAVSVAFSHPDLVRREWMTSETRALTSVGGFILNAESLWKRERKKSEKKKEK